MNITLIDVNGDKSKMIKARDSATKLFCDESGSFI